MTATVSPVNTSPASGRTEGRMDVLDGFRFFAILSVILFHFYSRWAPPTNNVNLYPYLGTHDYFSKGYLGVQFFFMISGFVISYTLTRTNNFGNFWKKRIIRLLPAMAICSLITLLVFSFFDTDNFFQNSHRLTNFFYSLTFLSPTLLDHLLRFIPLHGNYIQGSYWSLWPEIQFYFFASLVYYIRPKKFFTAFTLLALLLYCGNRFLINIQGSNFFDLPCSLHFINSHKFWMMGIFNLPYSILWFLMGGLFYQIYSKQQTVLTFFALLMAFYLQQHEFGDWKLKGLLLIMQLMFILFIWRPSLLRPVSRPIFTSVGVASYSLYLIHENIGVYLIHYYGNSFGLPSVLFPIALLGIFIGFSLVLYRFVERPVAGYFKVLMDKRSTTKAQ